MSTQTTQTAARAWHPDVTELAAIDAIPDALVLLTTTLSREIIEGDAVAVRAQYVDDDTAEFIAEGDTIPDADPTLAEVLVYTGKVSQLIRISSEQFHQENAASLLSESVARAVTKAANAAYIAQPKPDSPSLTPPAGLINVAGIIGGITPVKVSNNLNALIDLQAQIATNNGDPSHIVLSPQAWADLRKFKLGTDYAASLLGAGTTDTVPMLLDLPVIVSNAVPAGKGLMLDKTAIVSAVGPVVVAQSEHAFFAADSIALRCTWRFGANLVHPDRAGVFTVTTSK